MNAPAIIPEDLQELLRARDAAEREYLRTCWLEATPDECDAAWLARSEAKSLLANRLNRWISRHAREFQEIRDKNRGALTESKSK